MSRFANPHAALNSNVSDVPDNALVEAMGIDGRYDGEARSFPGFRALGLNVYVKSGTNYHGPLLVGPGIDHTTNGFTATWIYFDLLFNRSDTERVKFFKALEFKQSNQSSRTISGFVMMVPYNGEVYTSGTYNKGLPFTTLPAGKTERYVVVYIYWDDQAYPHPSIGSASHAPGWRCRILNATEISGPTEIGAEGANNLDCSGWGEFGYIVNPDVSGTGASWWGGPKVRAGTFFSGTDDGGEGPQVLYYDDTLKYVRLRVMGAASTATMRTVEAPSTPGTLPAVGNPCTAQAPVAVTTLSGRIYIQGGTGTIQVAATLRNSASGTRTALQVQNAFAILAATRTTILGNLELKTSHFTDFDTLELWRSPVGTPGVVFLENSYPLGTAPAYNAAIDCTASDRVFLVGWGVGDVAATTAAYTNRRYTFLSLGQFDLELMQKEAFDGLWEFTGAPPKDMSRILVANQQTFCVAAKGGNFDDPNYDNDVDGPPRSVVPSRLRWSSLGVPRPENFASPSNLWFPDEEVGSTFGLVRAGDWNFAVGNRAIVAFRAVGDRVEFVNLDSIIVPINRFCYCRAGRSLFVLSKDGLWAVDGGTLAVTPVDVVNRKLSAEEDWGFDVYGGSSDLDADLTGNVGLDYDESGNVLFVRNSNRGEAILFWLRNGRTTTLTDFWWRWSTQAFLPTTVRGFSGSKVEFGKQYKRVCFIEENGLAEGTNTDAYYLDVWFPDFFKSNFNHSTAEKFCMRSQPVGTNITAPVTASSGTITACSSSGGIDYIEIPGATGGDVWDRVQAGAIVYLFDSSGSLICRRMIQSSDALTSPARARYWLWPSMTSGQRTAASTGLALIAPVVVRIIDKVEAASGQEWPKITVTGGQVDMDLVSHGIFPFNSTLAGQWKAFAVGYGKEEGAITTESTYRGEVLEPSTALSKVILPVGILEEVKRSSLTLSRKVDETAFSLAFGETNPYVGIEVYAPGLLISLLGARISGTMSASNRKV